MKIFVNVARLEIGQLFTQDAWWGHLCTLDTFLDLYLKLIVIGEIRLGLGRVEILLLGT